MSKNNRAKGNRSRRKAIGYLEGLGYLVETVEKTGRFQKYKDLFAGYCFSCGYRKKECCDKPDVFEGFDLIALGHCDTIYVQVKTNTPAVQKHYKLFAQLFAAPWRRILVMTWYDKKGWRIQEYMPTGEIEVQDLRK